MNWFGSTREYYGEKWFSAMEIAYPQLFRRYQSGPVSATLMKRDVNRDRVAVIISGGGSDGPLLPGFVGNGLADACVVGAPYSAPNAYSLYEVSKDLGKEKGVLLIFNHFMGDYLNNDMAAELLQLENYAVEIVPVQDDIGTGIGEPRENRGGRCALPFLIKIASAAAEQGKSLEEVASLVRKANLRTSTLSMVVDTQKNMVSYGNGFSGEPGFFSLENANPQSAAEKCTEMLLADVNPSPDEKLFLLVNRLKMTSYADSYIMAGHLHHAFSQNHPVAQLRVGAYMNVLDVYGYTVTVLCADEEIAPYLEGVLYGDSYTV